MESTLILATLFIIIYFILSTPFVSVFVHSFARIHLRIKEDYQEGERERRMFLRMSKDYFFVASMNITHVQCSTSSVFDGGGGRERRMFDDVLPFHNAF